MKPIVRIVLCLNDFPIGVYTDAVLADYAAHLDWARREEPFQPWKPCGMQFGEGELNGSIYKRYHYHQHEFVVDADAKP